MSQDNQEFRESTRFNKLEKLLTCSCCNQIFMEPATLFCQHTFCQSCIIMNNENDNLECPKCKENVVVPVANNFQLRDIITKIYGDDYFKERKQKFEQLLANNLKLKKKYEIYKTYFNTLIGKISESNGQFIATDGNIGFNGFF